MFSSAMSLMTDFVAAEGAVASDVAGGAAGVADVTASADGCVVDVDAAILLKMFLADVC